MTERKKKRKNLPSLMDGDSVDEEMFDVEAVNPRYGTARMSDVALALMRPQNPKVAAIIEARRDELEDT
ncbi:hypothetical protein [Candidatus Palauibacter sp.]|uniref:hypothetical protein n=1 Tax=Candidatus Palauibacter sp. TaxID=3101350 RepID=UPI003B51F690